MMLIGVVCLALDPQVLLKSLLCLQQPLGSRAGNRLSHKAPVFIELVARLAQPSLTALRPSDDHLGIKRELHFMAVGLSRFGFRVFSAFTLARELLLGFAQRSSSPLTGLQMLRQLIAARLAVELVLGGVDVGSLLQDLPRELLVVEV